MYLFGRYFLIVVSTSVLCFFFCYEIAASLVASMAPTILTKLGWATAKAQLMRMPICGIGIVFSFAISVIASTANVGLFIVLVAICINLLSGE
jgi:hypothetical protein